MSKHDPRVTLRQMRDHAREALEMARGRARRHLDADRTFCLALVRLLEVLGEAASRVPIDIRARLATIPWAQVIGMRNRLIHTYDEVDLDVVWRVATDDLEPLVSALDRELER